MSLVASMLSIVMVRMITTISIHKVCLFYFRDYIDNLLRRWKWAFTVLFGIRRKRLISHLDFNRKPFYDGWHTIVPLKIHRCYTHQYPDRTQDIYLIILRHSLQNYWKTWKKCLLVSRVLLMEVVIIIPVSKGLN